MGEILLPFTFNNGVLSSGTVVKDYSTLGDFGGPSQVSFSPDGNRVAVSTWGVPQFGAASDNIDSTIQKPSRIYFYDVTSDASSITLSSAGIFQKTGVSGSIGFSWSSDSEIVFVANFNLADTGTNVLTNGVTVISVTGATGTTTFDTTLFVSGTGDGTNGNEVCWTWLSPDNTRLYTASFATNKITYFKVSKTGALSYDSSYTRILQITDPDTKDIYVTRGGGVPFMFLGP